MRIEARRRPRGDGHSLERPWFARIHRSRCRAEQDARFGDPASSPTPWSEVRQVLDTAELFWISTVRGDGRPHVTPLTAVWTDDCLHFCTGASEQKAVNLAGNPEVVLTTGCNQWNHGLAAEQLMTRAREADRL
jgi:hypothetical protein